MKKVLTLLAATTALTACNFDTKSTSNEGLTEEQVKMIIDNYVEENAGKIYQEIDTYIQKMQMEQQQAQLDMQKKALEGFKLDKDTPVLGNPQAPITIVEFSDFECAFCKKAHPTIKSLLKKYDGQVKVAYKHLPLDFHKNAKPAALASIAAHNQGKFWEFHDEIFANQQNLTEETLMGIAEKLKLDMAKFKEDIKSKEAAEKLAYDMQEAQKFGISGTPFFLVNGEPISGALPEQAFVQIIEAQLDKLNK